MIAVHTTFLNIYYIYLGLSNPDRDLLKETLSHFKKLQGNFY